LQPQDDPTTQVSAINVHHHPHNEYAHTDPSKMAQQARQAPAGDAYSAGAAGDGRNRGAHAAGNQQKAGAKSKKVEHDDLSRFVAEEKESKGKLPKYPGLERWKLLEKMGDGAFSNVYRAQDLEGKAGEVAIKVVRKFELNSSQVSTGGKAKRHISFSRRGVPYQRVRGVVGRCTSTSGLQEAKSCGGGHYFL
jgi:serine/threonine-protein kinase RCK2